MVYLRNFLWWYLSIMLSFAISIDLLHISPFMLEKYSSCTFEPLFLLWEEQWQYTQAVFPQSTQREERV